MAVSPDYLDYLLEGLAPLGPVGVRRMFSGRGLFLDGMMFAIVIDDELWLKVDGENRPRFLARDLAPFSYQRAGKTATMNYYRAPEEALDSPDVLLDWARSALGAALRARAAQGSPKPPKPTRPRRSRPRT